jgi:hypothetical protein
MIQSQVPTAPNLDILTEIVTDTRTAPSKGSAGHSPLAERRATSDAAPSWSPVSVALIAGIEFLSREAIWSEFNLPPLKRWYALVPRDAADHSTRWFNQKLCLDQASSRSESAAFLL